MKFLNGIDVVKFNVTIICTTIIVIIFMVTQCERNTVKITKERNVGMPVKEVE